MQVFVKTLTGKTITLEVELEDLVEDIKDKIEQKEHVGAENIRLICQGMQLENDKSLKHYNLKKECTFHMVLTLRGNGHSIKADKGLPIPQYVPGSTEIEPDTVFKVTFPIKNCTVQNVCLSERAQPIIEKGVLSLIENGKFVKGTEVISGNSVAYIPKKQLKPGCIYVLRIETTKVKNKTGYMQDKYDTSSSEVTITNTKEYFVKKSSPVDLNVTYGNAMATIELRKETFDFYEEFKKAIKTRFKIGNNIDIGIFKSEVKQETGNSAIEFVTTTRQVAELKTKDVIFVNEITKPVLKYIEESNKRARNEKQCTICLDNERDCVYVPCGHTTTCMSCSKKISECPVCRNVIQNKYKIYL